MMAKPLSMLLSLVFILINDGSCGPALWDNQCCYVENVQRQNFYEPSNYNNSANSPDLCIASCKAAGFSFAGVYRRGCRCGIHSLKAGAHQSWCYPPGKTCLNSCPGNKNFECGHSGDDNYMNIYSTGNWSISFTDSLGIFEKQNERELNSSLIASFSRLGKEWKVNHEFKPSQYLNDFSNESTASSLYLTAGDDNETVAAISFHPSYGMRVEYEANGKTFFTHILSRYLPRINGFIIIDIYQELLDNKYMINVGLNHFNMISVENKLPREFTNVRLFSGDPRHVTQPGFIRDLHVLTKTKDCCYKMTIGGTTYELQGTADMTEHGCIYNCVYTSTEAGDSGQYCFAPGDHAVQCGAPVSTLALTTPGLG
jgi:hypothetical protein